MGKQRDKSEPGIVGALQLVGAEVLSRDTPAISCVVPRARVPDGVQDHHKGRKKPLKDKRQVEQASSRAHQDADRTNQMKLFAS